MPRPVGGAWRSRSSRTAGARRSRSAWLARGRLEHADHGADVVLDDADRADGRDVEPLDHDLAALLLHAVVRGGEGVDDDIAEPVCGDAGRGLQHRRDAGGAGLEDLHVGAAAAERLVRPAEQLAVELERRGGGRRVELLPAERADDGPSRYWVIAVVAVPEVDDGTLRVLECRVAAHDA